MKKIGPKKQPIPTAANTKPRVCELSPRVCMLGISLYLTCSTSAAPQTAAPENLTKQSTPTCLHAQASFGIELNSYWLASCIECMVGIRVAVVSGCPHSNSDCQHVRYVMNKGLEAAWTFVHNRRTKAEITWKPTCGPFGICRQLLL